MLILLLGLTSQALCGNRAVPGASGSADPHQPPTARMRCTGSTASSAIRRIWSSRPARPSWVWRRRHRGDLLRRAGQSPLSEAQGREGRHESHHSDLAAHLPGRLLRSASRPDATEEVTYVLRFTYPQRKRPLRPATARSTQTRTDRATSITGSAAIPRFSPSPHPMMACTRG